MTTSSDEVDAYEARTHLARLLPRVAAGARVTITQRGRAVAELVPVDDARRRDAATAAARMRTFMERHPPIEGVDVRALIEHGRD